MTITAVGSQEGGLTTDNATSTSRAFGSNVTSGNLIVVVATKYSTSSDPFVAGDCTKSAGTATVGTISLDLDISLAYDGAADSVHVGIFSCLVTGTGSCTMQIAGGLAGSYWCSGFGEYNSSVGWDSSRLEDTASASDATDGDTTAVTGNADSAGAALFIGGVAPAGGSTTTITPDGAFTTIFEEEDGAAHSIGSIIRRIVSGATTDSFDWTLQNNTLGHAEAGVVYKEAAGAGDVLMPQIWM